MPRPLVLQLLLFLPVASLAGGDRVADKVLFDFEQAGDVVSGRPRCHVGTIPDDEIVQELAVRSGGQLA